MAASIFIAKLLSPFFIAAGIAFLVKRTMFRGIVHEFIASEALLYLAGILGLLSGLALTLTHNVWTPDWQLIITLIGWVTIARALITIFQPRWIVYAGEQVLKHRGYLIGAAIANLIIGAALSYFGYLA
ncbi:MAG: hypothetical protein WBX25_30425 [Rhodomicrobium sp.]